MIRGKRQNPDKKRSRKKEGRELWRQRRRAKEHKNRYAFIDSSLEEIKREMRIDFDEIVSRAKGVARIMDLGCGTGRALKQLRGKFPDPKRVELAGVALNWHPNWKKSDTVKWIVAPSHKLKKKFPKKKFDLVYSYYGLEHSPNLKRDVRVLWNLLKEGGLLVSTMPFYRTPQKHGTLIKTKPEYYVEKMPGFKLDKKPSKPAYWRSGNAWFLRLKKVPEKK